MEEESPVKDTETGTELSQSLVERIYYAARDGMPFALFDLLTELRPEQVRPVLNQVVDEYGERCTPLMAAARYGRDKVVIILLSHFQPDLEQEGTVKLDEYVTEGATALWCAAGAGRLTVVKLLVRAGANVNHLTKTGSTPLRAACFDGRLDIVKYLTEHNADVNISNKFNNTCLMTAAYKGHLDVVSYLLEKGADPNQRARCGATALHFAAERGHKEIVLELLVYGAKMTKNVYGMTPLMTAAERTQAHIVECLVEKLDLTKEEIIDAYELLGASYVNDRHRSLTMPYNYLWKAMKLRYSDPDNVIHKKLGPPIKAYQNWRESETLEVLDNMRRRKPQSIYMESLAIRERILGPHNPEVPHGIIFSGAVEADMKRFDRCIDLWLHALKLRQLNKVSIVKDLLRFAQVFSQMIHVGNDVDYSQVLCILEASVAELRRVRLKMFDPESKDDMEQYMEELEANLTNTLYIVTIVTKVLALVENKLDPADVSRTYAIVRQLCSLNVRLRDGQTLLHLAVNADIPVDDFHTNNVCKFPCVATSKLLIECGADVNAMDNERNTPLHVIVSYRKPISDFTTLHSIITQLIEAGAHMDTVNSSGKTPYDAVTTGVAEIILKTKTKLSLQCMAAKVIKAYNLPYVGHVPRCLESFIELHGPGCNQG